MLSIRALPDEQVDCRQRSSKKDFHSSLSDLTVETRGASTQNQLASLSTDGSVLTTSTGASLFSGFQSTKDGAQTEKYYRRNP
jgi:hypothetical protein